MTQPDAEHLEPVPPGTVVFHIGLTKTGSTALQSAVAARRDELPALGARYPGRLIYHNTPVHELMHADGDPTASTPKWDRLVRQTKKARRARVLISAEGASGANPRQVERMIGDLGRDTRVVLTLRGVAERLPSVWQQRVRKGVEHRPLDDWLAALLDLSDGSISDQTRMQSIRLPQLLAPWLDAVGSGNVTAVVIDRTRPTLLYSAFERLLGLPDELFSSVSQAETSRLNRGLNEAETEFVRHIRIALDEHGVTPAETAQLLHRGGFLRLQSERTPGSDEPKLRMPRWAAERAAEFAAESVEWFRGSGIRIVGDIDTLAAMPATREDPVAPLATVPVDLALEVVLGVVARATGRDFRFAPEAVHEPHDGQLEPSDGQMEDNE